MCLFVCGGLSVKFYLLLLNVMASGVNQVFVFTLTLQNGTIYLKAFAGIKCILIKRLNIALDRTRRV
ncbi:MAG: hypothetical protein CVU27_01555 [Betaproteobacteria bacterium HGW-Betaproteobacteria-20]|nr:MAG: hypothetical protein CVU27_01555 [Betaproteobacteria bacterium HGW-Betaproteobacteria-20]